MNKIFITKDEVEGQGFKRTSEYIWRKSNSYWFVCSFCGHFQKKPKIVLNEETPFLDWTCDICGATHHSSLKRQSPKVRRTT